MSRSNKAYQIIKEKIITLELKPLQVIDERVLMDSLQLGRTPIREALHRLAGEDLVIIAPRRGMFVADISITNLQQISEVRVVVEGYCAQLAAQRATEAQIAQMEQILKKLEQAPSSATMRDLMTMDESLHHLMYEAADNKFLMEISTRLHALSLRLWYLAADELDNLRSIVEDHRGVIKALKARDGPQAAAAIQQHIMRFQQEIKAVL